uniref:uncharacterized protein LOC109959689 n=1 Tax=Monopterus albus TaxID=43700 RepID=UPI0009B2FD02|nr:uncharacterized protein LOC109959689 [Monopterus albus]
MNTSVENKKKLKQDKSKKRALMKRTPMKCQLKQEGKCSLKSKVDIDLSDPGLPWPGSDSDFQVKKASAPPWIHRLVPVDQTPSAVLEAKNDQQPPRQSAQTLNLRNKPGVSEPVRERMQRRPSQDEHHKSKYKTGIDGIDWESLTRQTDLWRRHSRLVNSECGTPSSSEAKTDYYHTVSTQSPYSALTASARALHPQVTADQGVKQSIHAPFLYPNT